MTNQQHPITPPPELVAQWIDAAIGSNYEAYIAAVAAQWGWDERGTNNEAQLQERADQELEACCEWLQDPDLNVDTYKLRAARRPKLLSLKEQAYAALDTYIYGNPDHNDKQNTYNTIRKALEQLND